ncbi:hypothetical protein K8I28_07995 [bacterium]|nr:hypothetical protein [bacterium]
MRRLFLLILIFIMLSTLCFSQIYLSGAQSDTLDAGEYIVEDDIWVESHTLWYLRPGVVLRFYEGVRCTNHGALYAMGAEGDSIRFESFEEGIPWRGINLETTNYRTKLNYIVVTGSDDSGISVSPMSTMTLRHSRISHNTVQGDVALGFIVTHWVWIP